MTRAGAAAAALFLVGALGAAAPGAAARSGGASSATAAKDARGAGRVTAIRRRCRPPARRGGHRRRGCSRAARPAPLERLVDLAPPVPAPGEPVVGDPAPPPPPAPLARYLSVAAREFSLTLSRPVVGAGSVTVELRNVGEDPHNLIVGPDDASHSSVADFPETGPGERFTKPVELAAGRYRLWCSVDGHEAAGMTTALRVE